MSNCCSIEDARAAKQSAQRLLEEKGIEASVGITRIEDGYGLKVNVQIQPADSAIPERIEGVPVRVDVTGSVRKR